MATKGFMTDEMTAGSEAEGHSLDVVQRAIISILIGVVLGLFGGVLALYLAVRGHADLPHGNVVGLWVMTGVVGLITSAAILLVNRRKPYHPLVLLGLLPMAASAYWVFV